VAGCDNLPPPYCGFINDPSGRIGAVGWHPIAEEAPMSAINQN
jgi:hypothetical protein